jgi:glycosyltransferase involved in cell wall biosynthesis
MISVLILTRNEQLDLPGCLASVSWSDDVHVFDSFSTDATPEIARSAGAHLHQRHFDDYAYHRNAALQIPFTHPWLLIIDADERPTPRLCDEMLAAVQTASPQISGFRLRRRDFLFGVWLKHAQISPFYIRLVRPERSRYNRPVNEVIEIEGYVGELTDPLDHLEAELIVLGQGLQKPSWREALRNPDFHIRRLHQKALFYKLPARPLLKWLYMVIVRRSFLDGGAGITYSTLQAIYEYFIVLKVKELQRN